MKILLNKYAVKPINTQELPCIEPGAFGALGPWGRVQLHSVKKLPLTMSLTETRHPAKNPGRFCEAECDSFLLCRIQNFSFFSRFTVILVQIVLHATFQLELFAFISLIMRSWSYPFNRAQTWLNTSTASLQPHWLHWSLNIISWTAAIFAC